MATTILPKRYNTELELENNMSLTDRRIGSEPVGLKRKRCKLRELGMTEERLNTVLVKLLGGDEEI